MRTLTPPLRMAITIGCFVLIEGIIVGTLIFPSIKDIRALSSEIEDRRRDLEARYLRGARLGTIKALHATLAPNIDTWKQFFVPANAELDIITQLETIAGNAGVTQLITFPESGIRGAVPPGATPLPIALAVDGAFPRVLSYLRALERLPLFISVTTWGFTEQSSPAGAEGARDRAGNVSLHLELSLWHLQ